jgi:hypothetical protein
VGVGGWASRGGGSDRGGYRMRGRGGGAINARASGSPNLDAAMVALKAAKTDADPVPDLQQALKRLNRATNEKGGSPSRRRR